MSDRCAHVTRVAAHPSVRLGGTSVGQCECDCLPGMTTCERHATRDAMAMHIRQLWKRLQEATDERE